MKRTTWFIFFLLLAVSCLDEPDCYSLTNNQVGFAFKVFGINSTGVLTKVDDTKAFASIKTVNSDFEFNVGNNGSKDTLLLPVNSEQVAFTFTDTLGNNFNLALGYTRQVQFVSEECGERYIFTGLKILEHDWDSARVVDDIPGVGRSNIEIYRCAQIDSITFLLKSKSSEEVTSKKFFLNTDVDTTNIEIRPGKFMTLSYLRTKATLGNACGTKTFFYSIKIKSAETLKLDTASTSITKAYISYPEATNIEVTFN